jgi:hypothetical protein
VSNLPTTALSPGQANKLVALLGALDGVVISDSAYLV